MKMMLVLMAILCLCDAQYGDSSGIGAGITLNGFSNNNGYQNGGNNFRNEPEFFHDGRDGDIRSLWAFGVNGFFIPPPDFAGLPFLATNGTIIPTAAVGLICFDGVGGCSLEVTAVVGGNLGRQVFNVTMNKVRFISNLCRVRVSRLGRVIITAKLSEVSTRLLPMPVLSIPIVVVAQLTSRFFAFIEFDQLFVMQGEAVRIRRFDNFLNNNNINQVRNDHGKDGQGNGNGNGYGPGMGGGPGMGMGGPGYGGGAGGAGGPGQVWGDVQGGANLGNGNNYNNNNGNNFGVCPNLLDDSQFSDGGGNYGGNYGGGYGGGSNGGYDDKYGGY